MIWRRPTPPPRRRSRHGRHGRLGRSQIVSPPMPGIASRIERFDLAVTVTAEYLRDAWEELRDVQFAVAGMPLHSEDDGIPRWKCDADHKRITIYRVPVQRLERLHRHDDLHTRMIIEAIVFRAAAEYLGRDPWDLAPDRRHG